MSHHPGSHSRLNHCVLLPDLPLQQDPHLHLHSNNQIYLQVRRVIWFIWLQSSKHQNMLLLCPYLPLLHFLHHSEHHLHHNYVRVILGS
ncbi:hypothetical protein QL285_096776 [Trifolium repens]|nr:hypothetical protein QL285_096776 [Trifolium repens]